MKAYAESVQCFYALLAATQTPPRDQQKLPGRKYSKMLNCFTTGVGLSEIKQLV
jgi:hypothetical protein